MALNTDPSERLLTQIKSTHSNNKGTTFHILREYIEKTGLSDGIEQEVSKIQKLDGEASQFKSDASEVKNGNISIDKLSHEEEEIIEHLAVAGSSLAEIYNKMESSKGEKKRVLKIILLECGFYFWTAYKFIKHGTTILTTVTQNKSYKKAFNEAGKKYKGVEFGIKLVKSHNIDQDYERKGGIFNRFNS